VPIHRGLFEHEKLNINVKQGGGEKVFEVKVFDHQVGRTLIKKCYEGKELDEIKKEWRFEKTWHYNKQLDDDVTTDVKELWWEERRGFYSVVLEALQGEEGGLQRDPELDGVIDDHRRLVRFVLRLQ